MEMVEDFIKYDIKITDEGMKKGLAKQKEQEHSNRFII
jgi:hypothetical protein